MDYTRMAGCRHALTSVVMYIRVVSMTKTPCRVIHLLTEDKVTDANKGVVYEVFNIDLDKWDDISKQMIGGYIEVVHPQFMPLQMIKVTDNPSHASLQLAMLVDEDGHAKQLTINPMATVLYGVNNFPIVGDAWIVAVDDYISDEGWTQRFRPIPDDFNMEHVHRMLQDAIDQQLDLHI
jgi:hypothetical protein